MRMKTLFVHHEAKGKEVILHMELDINDGNDDNGFSVIFFVLLAYVCYLSWFKLIFPMHLVGFI